MLKSTEKHIEVNSIAKESKLEGALNTEGDIRIDGQLKGAIVTKGKLVLGTSGIIDGEVDCASAIISGEIQATIRVKELLTLKSTAKLSGEIIAGKLAIEPGAIFTGKCSMGTIVKDIHTKNEDTSKSQAAQVG